MSKLKNELVLKEAQIINVESQLKGETAKLESEKAKNR